MKAKSRTPKKTAKPTTSAKSKKVSVSGSYGFSTPGTPLTSPIFGPGADNLANTPLPTVAIPSKVTSKSKPLPLPVLPLSYYREELRLDVDGTWPQMKASGFINSLTHQIHWIAKMKRTKDYVFEGPIWYTVGTPPLGYTQVSITVIVSSDQPAQAVATFKSPRLPNRSMVFAFEDNSFRQMEFEFDFEQGIIPVLEIGTHDHDNRPQNLPKEDLKIETVFGRAGFKIAVTGGGSAIPSSDAGTNATWSDSELHDAMQRYWSRFANQPQWSLWTFFAQQHDDGPDLGGIMFDEIGQEHRQGTSIFYNSFISQMPPGDPQGPAFAARMKFWTTVHEMGHAFNLAHSWQKALGNPWVAEVMNEPDARSFMNYPFRISSGVSGFFDSFEYRFSDQELLFMRHAPNQFVQMGAENWFENHAFRWTGSGMKELEFSLRCGKPKPHFEFLEPVTLELKLKNISGKPIKVDNKSLADLHDVLLVIKRTGGPAKLYQPYSQRCFNETVVSLDPGKSLYDSLFVSAGAREWYINEPGHYEIQACLRYGDGYVVSNVLNIRVAPPRNYDEANVAQDYFTDDVGRVLQFDGSMELNSANDVLREVTNKLPNAAAAWHANIALAMPLTREFKRLETDGPKKLRINVKKARRLEANQMVEAIFGQTRSVDGPGLETVIDSLGNIDAKVYAEAFSKSLEDEGEEEGARKVLSDVREVFGKSGVLRSVRDDLSTSIDNIGKSQGN